MISIRMSIGAFLIAAMAGCGGGYKGSSPTSPSTPSSPTAVNVTIAQGASTLGASAFVPNPVTISAGTTVTWINTDTASSSHDVAADNGSFDAGTMTNGARFSFTYQTRGTFPYHCLRHPGMVGTVVVQ